MKVSLVAVTQPEPQAQVKFQQKATDTAEKLFLTDGQPAS